MEVELLNIDATVLKEDVPYARKLHTCAVDCLRRASNQLGNCNLAESEKWIVEYQRANQDLRVLQHNKYYRY